jgi:hypothetical protein
VILYLLGFGQWAEILFKLFITFGTAFFISQIKI